MTVEPSPLLIPVVSWAPLGLAIFGAQVLWVAICLRVRGRRLVLSGIALLATDVLLVIFMRACVAAMGRMDYSESFFRWRWFLLALVVAGAGLPVPLWALALRIVHRRRRRTGERTPLIHPVFEAALASWVTAAAIILATGGSFSFLPRPARITPVDVSIEGLPSQFDGLRIAVLADHHIGRLMTPQRARRRLESLAQARPDLVVDLGDITEDDPRYQPEAAQIIAAYKAPLGTYAVAGNFDVRCGTDTLREELARVGVVYLENEAGCVALNGADLWLVGIGDPWTGEDDLDRALAVVPQGATVVLLSHSPDIVEEAAGRGVPLMLSGHLHGGQIVVPFAGPALGMSRFGTRFAWGSWRVGPTQLIVSRGLGEEALPIRLFCPPEIVLLTLRAHS
jgi:predicted MPP superfamily phosphohydrolase